MVEKQKLLAVLRPIGELTEDKETPVRQANHGLRAAGHGPFFHSFRLMARFNASKSGRITADAVDQLKAYPIAPRSGIADQGFCVPLPFGQIAFSRPQRQWGDEFMLTAILLLGL